MKMTQYCCITDEIKSLRNFMLENQGTVRYPVIVKYFALCCGPKKKIMTGQSEIAYLPKFADTTLSWAWIYRAIFKLTLWRHQTSNPHNKGCVRIICYDNVDYDSAVKFKLSFSFILMAQLLDCNITIAHWRYWSLALSQRYNEICM